MSNSGSVVKVGSKSSLCASELGTSAVAAVRSVGSEDSAAMIQVKDKLKKLEGFANLKNKLQEEAERLVKPENLRIFFSHVLDDAVAEVVDQAVQDEERKNNGASLSLGDTLQVQHRRQQERCQQVSSLPVKLFLFCNRDHFTVNAATTPPGAVSVAIAVGGVLLEWCENNLVIPEYIDMECPVDLSGRILFHADVHYQVGGHAHTAATDMPIFLHTAAEEVEFNLEAVTTKAQAVENLIKVIANYNRYCYFDERARNSQRFVDNCMKALGIKQHSEYATQLNEHAKQLMQRGLSVPTVYEHHKDIDDFMETKRDRRRLELLSVVDLEYLLFVYHHQFHDGDGAECEKPNCMMVELRALLKKRVKPIFV